MERTRTTIPLGTARSSGPTVRELLAEDSRAVPAGLLDDHYEYLGSVDVAKARYTSPEFAELEAEYVWRRTWQLACFENDIPNAGDHIVYDVVGESVVVVRQRDGSIKAFFNSCLHRGTKLCVEAANTPSLRCPFHGWTWRLDGQLAQRPGDWDFAHLDGDGALPEVAIATWLGFVFVNLDPEPPVDFETYAAKLIEHMDGFAHEHCSTSYHAVKEVPANWKVCMEAFSEAYHVVATHPQIRTYTGDANTEYSVWPDSPFVSRMLNPFGIQSPTITTVLSQQQIADDWVSGTSRIQTAEVTVPDGELARQILAAQVRDRIGASSGVDLDDMSDTEALDSILYYLFPGFAPWAGLGQALVYRWRPGRTPDTCLMDVWRLYPNPDPAAKRPNAAVVELALEQPWTDARGMGGLAAVLEQDMANVPRVQAGLYSRGKSTVSLGNYQEVRIRLAHQNIDTTIAAGLARDGAGSDEFERLRLMPG